MSRPFTIADAEPARALMRHALAAQPHRLDLAAWAVATLETPTLSPEGFEAPLSALAERVKARGGHTTLERLQALRRVLVDEEGFRGNEGNSLAAENSLLDKVLESKQGLPIALSVVYLEVARRAGLPLFGVSFPGHFLVAIQDESDRKLVLDPFHGGALLTETGCEDLLRSVAPQVKFTPKLLQPAAVPAVSFRMLNNLKRLYLDRGDGDRALGVVDLMLVVAPDHPGELRSRASLLSALGAYRAALQDVERCLALSPDAPDHHSLELTAMALRERVEFLN